MVRSWADTLQRVDHIFRSLIESQIDPEEKCVKVPDLPPAN